MANMVKVLPKWLKKELPSAERAKLTKEVLQNLNLKTVCQDAQCPNLGECFARKRATFLILGPHCTRNCAFCAVTKGIPVLPDLDEPKRIAQAVKVLGLKHVIITSVTRDDLPLGGAEVFVSVINSVRKTVPEVQVEILTSDFGGNQAAITLISAAGPDIFGHNLETVRRLYSKVRPEANYNRSLELLARVKRSNPNIITKSGVMLGLGEKEAEIKEALNDLRSVGCDIVTIGQYLQPAGGKLPVAEYIHPKQFEKYGELALRLGFIKVRSGPFVRSSYLS
ncbi:MAG: Lipoyl synthase [Pelotomaculum sp. PtaB.Bin104]|nr:MAG: Lipoyl synthase [Pelotomaculum sp. PtaB.Bin104]